MRRRIALDDGAVMAPPLTAEQAFLSGVVVASVEHTLRLMGEHGWPFWAAALVARSETEIVLALMEE